jgi:trigger factor
MQVSLETTAGLERRMEVQVPAADVEKAVEDRLKSMSRTVRLKGFRPGKVPVKVVRQQFGQQVRQEVLGDVMRSSFEKAVVDHHLSPASGPKIEPINVNQGEDLKYRAVFEVFPEIKLAGLDGMSITKRSAEVTPADLDSMLENLRQQRAKYVPVQREARDTDRVTIDFEGSLDGVPFEGGKGENVPVVLGAGRMLADFEAGLRGLNPDQESSFNLTFPADYHAANLAGKEVVFKVKVRTVEERQLPEMDEEFCRSYGIEEGGIEQLRQEVEQNMRQELAQATRAQLRTQVFDNLLQANPLDLPNTLVDQQVRELQMDAARRMGIREASQLPPAENFRETARRRVALGLIINEVIRSAALVVDRQRKAAKLQELVMQQPDPAEAMRSWMDNAEVQRHLDSMVLEDQAIDWLLERANTTEQTVAFKELMEGTR